MTELDSGIVLEPATASEVVADQTSLLDRIKQRRDLREDFLTTGIPSWNDELLARYQVLDRSEIDKMVRRIRARAAGAQNGQKQQIGSDADVDFLIKACVGVIAHDNETEEEEELSTGFDMALAAMFGEADANGVIQVKDDEGKVAYTIANPRQLVVYLIKGNTIALASHSQKIAKWMQDTSKPVGDPQ